MPHVLVTVPAVVSAAGALVYGFAGAKAAELGRLAFACGLLALLLGLR